MKSASMSNEEKKILIVDDNPDFHRQLKFLYSEQGFLFSSAYNGDELKDLLRKEQSDFYLVILDLVLDESNVITGFDYIPMIRKYWPATEIIVATNDRKSETKAQAMELGASAFLEKFEHDSRLWLQQIKKALEHVEDRRKINEFEKKDAYINPKESPLIGSSYKTEKLRKSLKFAAEEDDTILLTGETGVGKGVAARFIHANNRKRAEQKFEEILLVNINKDLVPSELFGHKKGSFTDAKEDRIGRLALADKGVVFLDEVGDLSLDAQTILLQFLNSKIIRPLGTNNDIKLDVLIVMATNKNLLEEVDAGRFREDLYYRIADTIEIPPLRSRREDIIPLMEFFAGMSTIEFMETFDEELWQFFTAECPWRGNIRQLQNALRIVLRNKKRDELKKANMSCLPDDIVKQENRVIMTKPNIAPTIFGKPIETIPQQQHSPTAQDMAIRSAMADFEEIENALKVANGRKVAAAKLTRYKSADNMRNKVKRLISKYGELIFKYPLTRSAYEKELDET